MRIAICADEDQKNEFLEKGCEKSVELMWLNRQQETIANVDACIDLLFKDDDITQNTFMHNIPVLANAVTTATSVLPSNYTRINAWSGFLKRDIIEIATDNQTSKENWQAILNSMGWRFMWCPDEPGMMAARIISMVINEAYFAFGEKISTKEEIDIAMKLGTNYPYGPFEWSKKIGLYKIYTLLKKLNERESRYEIAPLLIEEAKKLKG